MFLKIDPKVQQTNFDLSQYGFLVGDKVQLALVGDFSAATSGEFAVDAFRNSNFSVGGSAFWADTSVDVQLVSLALTAHMLDTPLSDNSDPDGDYGATLFLFPFSGDDDTFVFEGRTKLPESTVSIYKALGGNDEVILPNLAIDGYDHGKAFSGGGGRDTIIGGALDDKIDGNNADDRLKGGLGKNLIFGGNGFDTCLYDGNLGTYSLTYVGSNTSPTQGGIQFRIASGQSTDRIADAEVATFANKSVPLASWHFEVTRQQDGVCTVSFYQNGEEKATMDSRYDEATPIVVGEYSAFFRNDGALKERIELSGVVGRTNIQIHSGLDQGYSEGCFTTGPQAGFLANVFSVISSAYAGAGYTGIPWQGSRLHPVFDVTVNVTTDVPQPKLQSVDTLKNDATTHKEIVRFNLIDSGPIAGLSKEYVEVFFTVSGTAVRGTKVSGADWDFFNQPAASDNPNFFDDRFLDHGIHSGQHIYSVMLGLNQRVLSIPITIFANSTTESQERIDFQILNIDLFRDRGGAPRLYHESGDDDYSAVTNSTELLLLLADRTSTITITADALA